MVGAVRTPTVPRDRVALLENAELKFHRIQQELAEGNLADERLDELLNELRETLSLITELYAADNEPRSR